MRYLILFLVAIQPALGIAQATNKAWCLTRTAPGDGSATSTDIIEPGNYKGTEWLFDPLIIDSPHNRILDCQDLGEQCNVSTGDLIYVTFDRTSAGKKHYKYTRVRAGRVMESGELSLSGQDRYLAGTIPGTFRGVREDLHFFVLYHGRKSCGKTTAGHLLYSDTNGNDRDCDFGSLEVYPASMGDWLAEYAPSGGAVDWGNEGEQCSGASQPGGGGGHDPPD